MRNYNENVEQYLSEEILGAETINVGEELPWIPFEEAEANFCFVDSIKPENDGFVLTMRVENEFSGEKYTKEYLVKKGSKLELNTFEIPFMCFLPPDKVPVLAEIKDISETSITVQTVGVLQEYAADYDKKVAERQAATK